MVHDPSLASDAPASAATNPTAHIWGPISAYFRTRRMRKFERDFALMDADKIIDVGGTETNWHYIETRPQVLMVNVAGETYTRGRFVSQRGDGTALAFPDMAFDLAYSNSVIEHLGSFENQKKFAREIYRIAPRFYVQTPNKWFPVEPHFLCPFIHWLPKPMFRRLVRWFSAWGWIARPTQAEIDDQVNEIRLLTVAEMRELFPDAELVRERVLGLTKSIIVMRR